MDDKKFIKINPDNIEIWKQTQVGQLVFCRGKRGFTSILVHGLHRPRSEIRGNIFRDIPARVSKRISKDGLYLCRIVDFGIDGKKSPYMRVNILTYLGIESKSHFLSWQVLFQSGRFASEFTFPDFRNWVKIPVSDVSDSLQRFMEDLPSKISDEYYALETIDNKALAELSVDLLIHSGELFLIAMEEEIAYNRRFEILAFEMVKSIFPFTAEYVSLCRVFQEWSVEWTSQNKALNPIELKQVLKDIENVGKVVKLQHDKDLAKELDNVCSYLYKEGYKNLHSIETYQSVTMAYAGN